MPWGHMGRRGTKCRWVVSLTPWVLYARENSLWYPLNRRLDAPQRRSGLLGEENACPFWHSNPGSARPQPSLHTDYGIPAQLLREKHPKDSDPKPDNRNKRPSEEFDMSLFNSDDRFLSTNKNIRILYKVGLSLCLSHSGEKKNRLEMF
jgi:hypothetical protein